MHTRVLETDQFGIEEDFGCAVAFLANLYGNGDISIDERWKRFALDTHLDFVAVW